MAWHGMAWPIVVRSDAVGAPRRILQLTLTNALVSSSGLYALLAETRGMCALPSQRHIALLQRTFEVSTA